MFDLIKLLYTAAALASYIFFWLFCAGSAIFVAGLIIGVIVSGAVTITITGANITFVAIVWLVIFIGLLLTRR